MRYRDARLSNPSPAGTIDTVGSVLAVRFALRGIAAWTAPKKMASRIASTLLSLLCDSTCTLRPTSLNENPSRGLPPLRSPPLPTGYSLLFQPPCSIHLLIACFSLGASIPFSCETRLPPTACLTVSSCQSSHRLPKGARHLPSIAILFHSPLMNLV